MAYMPNRRSIQTLALLCAAVTTACAAQATPTPTPAPTAAPTATPRPAPTATPSTPWKILWADEFDGPSGALPDAARWKFDVGGGGWGNRERQFYSAGAANASLDGNGALVITARKTTAEQARGMLCWYGDCGYTSARLQTSETFTFTYGRVEARMRLPQGQGLWPAFWMLGADITTNPWPGNGEIDIMENVGKDAETVVGTIHGPGYSGGKGIGLRYFHPEGKAWHEAYHVYAVDWRPDEIRWSVDAKTFFTATPALLPSDTRWVFDHPFFLLLNLAVGGQWPGDPNETTVFPQTLTVDYVRVYEANPTVR